MRSELAEPDAAQGQSVAPPPTISIASSGLMHPIESVEVTSPMPEPKADSIISPQSLTCLRDGA